MARILLGWEFGSGFGHVALLLPLARALKARGHVPVMALQNLEKTRHFWQDEGVRVIQAPRWPMPPNADTESMTYTLADVMLLVGYDNTGQLETNARAWQALVAEEKPDLIIAEFAPTLALATLGNIPFITIGTGYSVPPAGRRLPNIRFWQQEMAAASILAEDKLLAAVNAVRQALGLRRFIYFSDIFSGDTVGVCTWPELDCYAKHRTRPALGPLLEEGELPPPGQGERSGVFAYLAARGGELAPLLRGMEASGIACEAYVRGLPHGEAAAYSGVKIHEIPQPLAAMMPKLSAVMHHGGYATTCQALAAGVPQLVVSRQLEQAVTGAALKHLGVAHSLSSKQMQSPETLAAALRALVQTPSYAEKAAALALTLAQRRRQYPSALETILGHCDELLAGQAAAQSCLG